VEIVLKADRTEINLGGKILGLIFTEGSTAP
jgi:hypothetical protein